MNCVVHMHLAACTAVVPDGGSGVDDDTTGDGGDSDSDGGSRK